MNPTDDEQPPRQTPQGDTSRTGEPEENFPSTSSAGSESSSEPSPALAPAPAVPGPAPTGETPSRAPRVRRRLHQGDALLAATLRLQPRDRALTMLLDEHRTLTTTQIAAILYPSYATSRRRLYTLRTADWLDRFTVILPNRRSDTHWVLGPLGAHWAAGEEHRPPPTTKSARDIRRAIASSSHLAHTDGANQFFIDLLTHARHHPGTRLARWFSPARTAAAAGQRIHPDGHGVWEQTDPTTGRTTQVGFYLEYDTGTETLATLKNKLEPYRRLRQDGPNYPLLMWLPNPTREANLHRKLNGDATHLAITLATTTPAAVTAHPEHLTGPVWKIAGNGRPRHRLIDLPSRHGNPHAPYHPGPPTPQQDPLYRLTTT